MSTAGSMRRNEEETQGKAEEIKSRKPKVTTEKIKKAAREIEGYKHALREAANYTASYKAGYMSMIGVEPNVFTEDPVELEEHLKWEEWKALKRSLAEWAEGM